MAFTLPNWSCVSNSLSQGQSTIIPFMGSSTILNSPDLFTYGSPNDTAAEIMADNYFLSQYKSLSIGDVVIGFGTDTNFILQVTAVSSTLVSTEPFAGGGGIGGSGANLQLAVFSGTSTIGGSINLTYDPVNDIFNEGDGNTLTSVSSPTFSSIIQQGNGNTISQGSGSTSLGDVQIGWGNVINSSGVDAFTDEWNFQYGFENSISPSVPVTLNNNFMAGMQNSIVLNNCSFTSFYGQSLIATDNDAGHFIFQSTLLGFGGTINAITSNITGAMCYAYTGTVLASYATALGYFSIATNQGSFVVSDSTSTNPPTDTAANQFIANFAGGYYLTGSSTYGSPPTNAPKFLQIGSDGQIGATSSIAGPFLGSTTGATPASGVLGQQLVSKVPVGSAINLVPNIPANITSILLPIGIWATYGNVFFTVGGGSGYVVGWASLASATLPDNSLTSFNAAISGTEWGVPVPFFVVNITAPTNVFLSAVSGGASMACGNLWAVRIG